MTATPRDLDAFRLDVRSFFDGVPSLMDAAAEASVGDDDPRGVVRAALYDAGLAGYGFPEAFGGLGDRPEEYAVYADESKGRVPVLESVFGLGVSMALPMVRDYGSDDLRRRMLRPGLRGDELWCQLYSEPNAGSDLASLATKAERDGDEWIVSGQKVWTSGAQHADLAILLARTDAGVPKHRGITMFVLPMRQPGVTVRPLRQMTGVSEFNEVFLDEARLPSGWIVGDLSAVGGPQPAVAQFIFTTAPLLQLVRPQALIAEPERIFEQMDPGPDIVRFVLVLYPPIQAVARVTAAVPPADEVTRAHDALQRREYRSVTT